jgi:hypothetical protein
MAGALNLSPKTVEFHKKKLFDKLGVRSTAHLVRYAVRNGLIEPWLRVPGFGRCRWGRRVVEPPPGSAEVVSPDPFQLHLGVKSKLYRIFRHPEWFNGNPVVVAGDVNGNKNWALTVVVGSKMFTVVFAPVAKTPTPGCSMCTWISDTSVGLFDVFPSATVKEAWFTTDADPGYRMNEKTAPAELSRPVQSQRRNVGFLETG